MALSDKCFAANCDGDECVHNEGVMENKDFNILIELIEEEIRKDEERLRVKGYKYVDDTHRYCKIIEWLKGSARGECVITVPSF